MDKYLELIHEYQSLSKKLLESTSSKQNSKNVKSRELHNKEQEQKELEKDIETTKNIIELLKKYEGKNLFWEGVKDFFRIMYTNFKNYPFIGIITIISLLTMIISECIIQSSFTSLIIGTVIILMFSATYATLFWNIKNNSIKTTTLETEQEKLHSLESKLGLTKEQIDAINKEIESINKELEALKDKRKILAIDIQTIISIREQKLTSLLVETALNQEFMEDEEIASIMKRTRKE